MTIRTRSWRSSTVTSASSYALVGRLALLRIRFDTPTCTHCGECAKYCPEPQVLNLKEAAAAGMIASGECTNCGRCITVCPEGTLQFDLRRFLEAQQNPDTTQSHQRRAV